MIKIKYYIQVKKDQPTGIGHFLNSLKEKWYSFIE